jgi:FtsZ-interacting cell division protein ZipA
MFKAIKWLIIILIVAIIVLWITGYKIRGKTMADYARGIVGAKTYDEGIKDIRSLAGEAIKAVGEAVSPEPTADEKKELEDVIKKEMETPQTAAPQATAPQAAPAKTEKPATQPVKK